MNLKIAGIGAIAVVVIVIAVAFFAYYAIDGKWSTDWNEDPADVGGTWGEAIVITYADGSTESLKLILERQSLEVQYYGMPISYIEYFIYGSASGTEFTSCNIDVSLFSLNAEITSSSNTAIYFESYQYTTPWYLSVNGAQEILCSARIDVDTELNGLASGEYTIYFLPIGSIRYRGENGYDGDWQDADLPSGLTLVVDNIADGAITLDFSETWTWM